ncbi:MAG: DEAD/DEAH box helicase [Actinomycetota bacterium]|nr:DEAD/DEAH box helicase [Actinomycetota bacterium]
MPAHTMDRVHRYVLDQTMVPSYFDAASYARGLGYFRTGRVRSLEVHDQASIVALVSGTTLYRVVLTFSPDAKGQLRFADGVCDCPVGFRCKHMVAALLALAQALESDSESDPPADTALGWRVALSEMVAASSSPGRDTKPIALLFELQNVAPPRRYGQADTKAAGTSCKLAVRPAVKSDRTGRWVMSGVKWGATSNYGTMRPPGHEEWFHEWLALYTATEDTGTGRGYHGYQRYYYQAPAWCYLDDFASAHVWHLLAEARRLGIPFVRGANATGGIDFRAEPLEAALEISEREDGSLRLETRLGAPGELSDYEVRIFGSPAVGSYRWKRGASPDSATIVLAPLSTALPRRLASAVAQGVELRVPAGERAQFFSLAYPALTANFRVHAAEAGLTPRHARPRMLVQLGGDGATTIYLKLLWRYEDSGEMVAELGLAGEQLAGGSVVRDERAEEAILAQASGILGFSVSPWAPHAFSLSGMDALAFSLDTLQLLEEDRSSFVVEYEAGFPDFVEAPAPPTIRLGAEANPQGQVDWLDLTVRIEVAGRQVPVSELLSALHSGASRMLLDDGTHFSLHDPALARFRSLVEEARSMADAPPSRLRLSRFQIDLASELSSLGQLDEAAGSWLSRAAELTRAGGVELRKEPAELAAKLRPYQAEGYSWLAFLRELELGGILADDMGLGKTVQALALLLDLHAGGHAERPSLIVAPTSVAANWLVEAARFAPSLTVAHLGTTSRKEGARVAERIAGADLAVTTYTVLRLDEEEFAGLAWDCVVFDEAQFVKNHQSKGYRSARRLSAKAKFALTGTPLENNLMELWSILSLVAPGLLGSARIFREMYQLPIERNRDPDALARMRRRIRPLMLRRTKEEVVTELPGKSEQVVELALAPQHRRVYDLHLQRERQRILGLLEDFRENRITIFSSLTKLRQLSIDPSLVDAKAYEGIPSSKLEFLLESLEEITAEGHRALVFSQFTSFLSRIREALASRGVRHLYLDGATRGRGRLLEEFAAGEVPVFLISLKAGGFGLNLTAADYVYLVDPWWNPAAESQAVDRAHRIGQTRSVMIYRLVSQDTIEEKVVQLGKKKAELFAQVMEGVASEATSISAEDIRRLLEA